MDFLFSGAVNGTIFCIDIKNTTEKLKGSNKNDSIKINYLLLRVPDTNTFKFLKYKIIVLGMEKFLFY